LSIRVLPTPASSGSNNSGFLEEKKAARRGEKGAIP
jgi:hypothetical protein